MTRRRIRSVAILGGGPAGASTAAYLARAGLDVAVFARAKRPPIIIGESFVPAIVPFLQEHGIEEAVASYSVFKPGATFMFGPGESMSFKFAEVKKARTPYSYNVPRDRFDATLLEAARQAGARVFEHAAQVERVGRGDRLELSAATLAASQGFLGEQPDFIVDATGRTRTVARLLDLPAVEGDRRDTALHAHLSGVPLLVEGNVHTDRLDHGWSWRIPLPGRVSVGFVVDSEHLRKHGETIEEQYDSVLRHDSMVRSWGASARRLTPVVKYTNYQLRTTRGVGENWALVGDAFGFVDPVFSSGLLIGLEASRALARALESPSDRAFEAYERFVLRRLTVWQRVVSYYYDGRLFTLLQVGELVRNTRFGKLMDGHFRKHMPRVFTGEGTTRRYSLGLLEFMIRYGLAGNDPKRLEIR
jgi:hypothetical protein